MAAPIAYADAPLLRRPGMSPRLKAYKAAPEAMKAMAALAWTEALTLVSKTHAPDAVYEEARRHFSEEELVKLTVCIGAINAWNRIAIGFRSQRPVPKHAPG
jgi:alkylhydroperoxidase family enzyme